MNIKEINDLIVEHMKAGNKNLVSVLRMVKSKVIDKQNSLPVGKEITESQITAIIKDLYNITKEEASFVTDPDKLQLLAEQYTYLSTKIVEEKKYSEDETRNVVKSLIESSGKNSKKDLGFFMGTLKLDTLVDMQLAKKILGEFLV